MMEYKKELEFFKMALNGKDKGFPKFIANGTQKSGENMGKKYIVMSKHGYDLSLLLKICGGKFTYKTVLNISIELVLIIFVDNHLYSLKGYKLCTLWALFIMV